MTGDDIAAQARSYVGIPFRHWGRNRHGVDCVGLILCVGYDLGLTDYVPRPYSRQVNPVEIREQWELVAGCISSQEKASGDILLLRVRGVAQHLGYYCGQTLIHAFETAGRVAEVNYSPEYWDEKVAAVYRWKALLLGRTTG